MNNDYKWDDNLSPEENAERMFEDHSDDTGMEDDDTEDEIREKDKEFD